jgi:hypothetical protein
MDKILITLQQRFRKLLIRMKAMEEGIDVESIRKIVNVDQVTTLLRLSLPFTG